MKISHMLKREEFYSINENTLRLFYQNSKKMMPLYVYPNLNAIITKNPSKAVKEYLYTEYQVCGSRWKKILVHLYCWLLLNSKGVFASKRILIPNWADSNTLIYPCNRKYRIFDFSNKVVNVVSKDGFPTTELQNEIRFRTSHHAEFIPSILNYDNNGYSESIIDGYPVARSGDSLEDYSQKAYDLWRAYATKFDRFVSGIKYAETIKQEIEKEVAFLSNRGKKIDYSAIKRYSELLIKRLRKINAIPLTLSHGDFQAGNIWFERKTNKILIIDWESCGERSEYYDFAVLFSRIRYTKGLEEFTKNDNSDMKIIVLIEDLLFRLKELSSLPEQFGVNDFAQYMSEVESRLCLKN